MSARNSDTTSHMESNNSIRRICVFCGSSCGARSEYTEAAKRLGKAIVSHGMGLVYGGGSIGLMGVIADAVLQEHGEVIGVIPQALSLKEIVHPDLTELHIVSNMHERKAMMAELSGAFVAMPGGYGTFEEFFEVVTWAQLGLHTKPIGLLNVASYFDLLLALVDRAYQERFIQEQHRRLIVASSDTEELLPALIHYKPSPQIPKIIGWKET